MAEVVTSNVLTKLNELSARSTSIQGAIAYWCFPPNQLDPSFIQGISHAEGFLCCDLHSPTSIDCLAEMNGAGANIFLLLYQLVGKTEVPDSKGIPDHLMHSKVLVFNIGSTECVIWVGSHNATARALRGINFECALLETTTRGSSFHKAVMSHLQEIKGKSSRFRNEDIDYYRALQGGLQLDGFIEVEDLSGTVLHPGAEITVFGSQLSDHQQLTRVGSKLFLAVSQDGSSESIYGVSILQTGKFTATNRRAISFDSRRYAFKSNSKIPLLTPHQAVPKSVYENAAFFAVIAIDKIYDGYFAAEAPPEKLWQDIDVGIFRAESNLPATALPKYKIQCAAREDHSKISGRDQSDWLFAFQVLPLAKRQTLQSSSLFRRRILKKRADGKDDACL